ncbi:MAG TPA: aminoglycoside phosphotransferase family protein [Candidatus Acidoferrales bacterium]|nr:aminoglycoside phosphotransferase family protein [Candidatus Acidoferrales bacterium]
MAGPETFLELLRRDQVVRTPGARLTPLAGGVSCEIYLVEDGAERFVVKRALAKLNVPADWFADVKRNRHEWEYIRYVARFLPEAVPALRQCSAADNYFAMEHLNGSFLNWKQMLFAGQAKWEHSARAGNILGQIHRHSTGDPETRRRFDTTQVFSQLRLEPYLLATATKHPMLRSCFEEEAARLAKMSECLVHGDFSPKNILVGSGRMVLLDCEVAWYGDPAFDVAFLLNHFYLKALWHVGRGYSAESAVPSNRFPPEEGRGKGEAMKAMVEAFWAAYQKARPSPELESRVCRLLPMLLLARVDGKSPVEYLDSARQRFVREFARENVPRAIVSLSDLTRSWFDQVGQFKP